MNIHASPKDSGFFDLIFLTGYFLFVAALVAYSPGAAIIFGAVGLTGFGIYGLVRRYGSDGHSYQSISERRASPVKVDSKKRDYSPEFDEESEEEEISTAWMVAALPLMIIPFFAAIYLMFAK